MTEKFSLIIKQFNWRMLLMRILMYALLLALVTLLTPGIFFTDRRFLVMFLMAITFGVVSAVVRPLIQFLTLLFIFATYGLVVIFINSVILLTLSWLSGDLLTVTGLIPTIIGGVLIGLFGGFLESMLRLTAPTVPDSEEELRRRIAVWSIPSYVLLPPSCKSTRRLGRCPPRLTPRTPKPFWRPWTPPGRASRSRPPGRSAHEYVTHHPGARKPSLAASL